MCVSISKGYFTIFGINQHLVLIEIILLFLTLKVRLLPCLSLFRNRNENLVVSFIYC